MTLHLAQLEDAELLLPDTRLIYFDVDGTLLGLDGHYTEALRSQISRVQAMGIKTAIASGRPHFAAQFLFDELNLDAAGVFYTGALVYDPGAQRVQSSAVLPPETVARVVTLAREQGVYCEFYTLDSLYVEQPHEITEIHSRHLRCEARIENFDCLLESGAPVYKLLLGGDEQQQPGLVTSVEAAFPELTFAYAKLPARPNWTFASVIDAGADKTQAFHRLLDYHNVSAEQVMAFGDAGSDKNFLSLAGTGVALGNACEHVQQVANYITDPVWDDGVARALARLIR